jgi:hypothetical protein
MNETFYYKRPIHRHSTICHVSQNSFFVINHVDPSTFPIFLIIFWQSIGERRGVMQTSDG